MSISEQLAADAPSTSAPRAIPGPTSPQSSLIASGQSYVCFPTFTLESGVILHNVPLAYKTWGKLDPKKKNNALVVCHALTGSADVEDWWGPLLGPGKLFDPTRFFIVCTNVLGSPYGSAGPCTRKGGESSEASQEHEHGHWQGQGWWGPEFPATTVRDDVRITKELLDFLGVEQVAAVVGGSMGGMAVLEWPILFPIRYPKETPSRADERERASEKPYIRAVVPIATAARHSAWGISWAEAQRQSIYSDPAFDHGYYDASDPPRAGLAAARMAALLTYRSRDSFESRFGRRTGGPSAGRGTAWQGPGAVLTRKASVAEEAAILHNEGNKSPRAAADNFAPTTRLTTLPASAPGNGQRANGHGGQAPRPFSAQSYLRYQGDKFVKRFDANCYVHLTRKMDSHDVARGRAHWALPSTNGHEPVTARPIEVSDLAAERRSESQNGAAGEEAEVTVGEKRLPREGEEDDEALARVLGLLSQGVHRLGAPSPPFLVVSVESDGLFAPPEQALLHELIGGSEMVMIQSPDGHDGFLLEFEQINRHVEAFLRPVLTDIYECDRGVGFDDWKDWGQMDAGSAGGLGTGGVRAAKESMSGEVEDLTRW